MNEEEIKALVGIRKYLIENFNKIKDYKSNKNAIMREIDHAELIHKTISGIDKIIAKYVNFS